jgi:hypothetical protein
LVIQAACNGVAEAKKAPRSAPALTLRGRPIEGLTMSNRPPLRIAIGPCVLGLALVAGCNNADQGAATSSTTSPATTDSTPAPTTPAPGAPKATGPIDKGGPPSGAAGTLK